MVLDMSAVDLASINDIKIKYIVIRSTFAYLTTGHLIYSNNYQLHSGNAFILSASLTKSMSLSSKVFCFFIGWKIALNTGGELSNFAKGTMATTNSVSI